MTIEFNRAHNWLIFNREIYPLTKEEFDWIEMESKITTDTYQLLQSILLLVSKVIQREKEKQYAKQS